MTSARSGGIAGAALAAAAVLAAAGLSGSGRGGSMSQPDLVVVGPVWTGVPGAARAGGLAAKDGRIVAVGSAAEVRALAGPGTRTLDASGALVLPGFIDAHTHFLKGGFSLRAVQLRDARTPEEFTARIAARAKETAPGEWILEGNWDHQNFDPPVLPRREWIDAATRDVPVFVCRIDEHMALANTAALTAAGITRSTPVPAGGEIVKDPRTGEPTGILKDTAMGLVYRVIPPPSERRKAEALLAAIRRAGEAGVTSVGDMSGEESFPVARAAATRGELTVRIAAYVPITSPELLDALARDKARKRGDASRFLADREAPVLLRPAGLKGFVDGSLGSATALFFEPYTDDPSTRGLLMDQMRPEGAMDARVRAADALGRQVAIHAIGDRANDLLLSIYERAAAAGGPRDRRFRVEHAQHLRPQDIARFGRGGVVASVQPYHVVDDGRWAEDKIGPVRGRTSYPFRSLLRGGAVLACGSDWPVAPLDPLAGIQAAVGRVPLDGSRPGGWTPEERLTVEEAVRGFTFGGAYAELSESDKGTLEAGKYADAVVLDRDIFAGPADKIAEARVLATIVGGRVVFAR